MEMRKTITFVVSLFLVTSMLSGCIVVDPWWGGGGRGGGHGYRR
jgi:hypothetical protein